MTNSFGRTNSLTEEPLPILEELTRFLKFYLDPGEAKRIQKIAKYHVNHPDEDIKGFVKDVLNTLSETLQLDRRGLIEATQKLIQVYNERMKKAEDSDPVCSNISVCGSIRETAAKDLIEGLDAIIPEAKRSDLKVRASHVLKEDLDDFVNGFQEDLVIFMEEREIEITSNLKAKLNVFKNELVELSKQLRMASKINLVVEALSEEDIPEDTKKEINNLAEQIMNMLKSNSRLTAGAKEDVNKLTENVIRLAGPPATPRLKTALKELQNTQNFLYGKGTKEKRCFQ